MLEVVGDFASICRILMSGVGGESGKAWIIGGGQGKQ